MRLASIGTAVRRVVPALARDAFGVGGVGLISYGCWLIYQPAGYIVGGCLLLCGAVMLGGNRK